MRWFVTGFTALFAQVLTAYQVALSMADGFARVTNKPQCVIVHVDVGTSALGAAIHNSHCGKTPVLIFAGLSPYTIEVCIAVYVPKIQRLKQAERIPRD